MNASVETIETIETNSNVEYYKKEARRLDINIAFLKNKNRILKNRIEILERQNNSLGNDVFSDVSIKRNEERIGFFSVNILSNDVKLEALYKERQIVLSKI